MLDKKHNRKKKQKAGISVSHNFFYWAFLSRFIELRIINRFPNKPRFLRVCSPSLLKTLWEKEKLACHEQYLFFPGFSTGLEDFLAFSSNLKLWSANSLSLEVSKICHLGKGSSINILVLYKFTKFTKLI